MSQDLSLLLDMFQRGAWWALQYRERYGYPPNRLLARTEALETIGRFLLDDASPPVPSPDTPPAVLPAPVEPAAAPAPVSAPSPAPAKKARAKKSDRPAGWSEGAWAYQQAVLGAKTYDALDPTKVAARAMSACDRAEPILPNATFRATIPYLQEPDVTKNDRGRIVSTKTRNTAEAIVALRKLGVEPEQIHHETAEESARKILLSRLNYAIISVRPSTGVLRDSLTPDDHAKAIQNARALAREALAAGLRTHARELAREIGLAKRAVRQRWSMLSRAELRALGEERACSCRASYRESFHAAQERYG